LFILAPFPLSDILAASINSEVTFEVRVFISFGFEQFLMAFSVSSIAF